MRRLILIASLASACLAVAACHDRDSTPSPGASTDPAPVILDNGTVEPTEDGFTCPPRMPAAKCESLGGHYAPRRPGEAIP